MLYFFKHFTRKLTYCVALGFGSGLAPCMPGTCGTLAAIPLYWFIMRPLPPLYYIGLNVILTWLAIYSAGWVARDKGVHDSPDIVIDEMVGFWWAMYLVPPTPLFILLAFIGFRFFDSVKPWPIRWVDKHVGGGLGIVSDDLLAALFTWLILQIIAYSPLILR